MRQYGLDLIRSPSETESHCGNRRAPFPWRDTTKFGAGGLLYHVEWSGHYHGSPTDVGGSSGVITCFVSGKKTTTGDGKLGMDRGGGTLPLVVLGAHPRGLLAAAEMQRWRDRQTSEVLVLEQGGKP